MRTLLVDNYDSFTYNLFHYLAEVNGTPPEVISNDDPAWRVDWLDSFDNVVISPGPGTPARAADIGLCREIIEQGDLPVLGVCLGHQAIAHLLGGVVGRAPEPRHGRVSPVLHKQVDVFAGLPSPFEAVRYHSLAATDLPDDLEPIAWTPDGVLMGLRHRQRPLWGVQFHPESISTEHGHRLLANFADLTRSHQGRTPATARTEPATSPARVEKQESRTRLRVHVETLQTRWDDEVAFARLFGDRDLSFWLDSSRQDHGIGRYSVMGCADGPLARAVVADTQRGTVTVQGSDGGGDVIQSEFLDWLDRDLRGLDVQVPDLPFDFALGWVGYLGYELKSECGGDRVHTSPQPDAMMVFADRAVVFDHGSWTTYLLALSGDDDEAARSWLRDTAEVLASLVGQLPAPAEDLPALPDVHIRHDREQYLKLIDACNEAIVAGETYEVCLTNMIEARGTVDPWRSYRALRAVNPTPFGALLRCGWFSVLSTSPERFLRVGRDAVVESKPIKGTRPRGKTTQADELLRHDLVASEKDRSENLMIVDLVRNDLGRTAEIGTVRVPKLFDVETYATVHQLVSTVQSTLRSDTSAVACVRAAFPGGSMTGAPKIRTMKIIDSLEAGPRGVYSGAIGYFSLSGAADLSIVIRTTVVEPERVTYGVGGAIVALSDPAEEFEETAVKAAPLLRLLGATFPGREQQASRLG
ncbi:MAG TPA: aminodeoxychorismate synthase component I [Actinomycetes bacterium]|nr:aminodeoxychorismate synthase component I [Actinomycetes bacterium]